MSLQRKVINYLKKQPCVWLARVEVATERGCPDILCCVYGHFLAIEIKEGKDYLSKIQSEQLQRILDAKGQAWVIYDYEDFVKKLDRMMVWCKFKEGMDGSISPGSSWFLFGDQA